jgi:bifunctional DNA-binding transcriptional regulator/antitoxin component of YhaV-PrlF toxin-antitoxin module
VKDGLAISMPREVVKTLGIREGDDIDFIQYKDSYYIIAKRSDIAKLITGSAAQAAVSQQQEKPAANVPKLSEAEISVLKKLDTLRYSMRTTPEVAKILGKEERITFKQLEKKHVIVPFKDEQQKTHYSIQKMFYDNYLMRKRPAEQPKQEYKLSLSKGKVAEAAKSSTAPISAIEKYMDALQNAGYIVVPTEAEASAISAALEDSIRRGLVVGTRAFNKKFYIVMRSFINANTPAITAQISDKSSSVPVIAKACKLDEEAIRAVLYILAESGEVTEVRKDIFRLA